jgi:hypothetical protein
MRHDGLLVLMSRDGTSARPTDNEADRYIDLENKISNFTFKNEQLGLEEGTYSMKEDAAVERARI